MIVLDTNVVSELMRPIPHRGVARWVAARPASSLFTTTITQAEIFYGVRMLPRGRRRDALETSVRAMFDEDLGGRILSFGPDAALLYAEVAAERCRVGRPISHFDAQIVAIARAVGATLATRNVRDFEGCGVRVVDPWTAR
jgi:predicted nucleic acid-binding protein